MEWQTLLEEGIRPGDNRMVVNLAQVPYMSSAGLQILINLARRFSGPEQCFAIGGTGRLTRKVIQASGFEEMLRVRDTEAAALVTVRTAHLEDED